MLGALAIVAYPLLRSQGELSPEAAGADPALEDLLSQRDSAYAGIKELEFEHELGNLSQSDFQALREDYLRKAAKILEELETAASSPRRPAPARATSPEDEIEAAVQRMRQRRPTAALATCPLCREAVAADDQFCANCGAALSRFCSGCGEPREPADRFCRSCGRPAEARQ